MLKKTGGGQISAKALFKECKYNFLKSIKKFIPLHLLATFIALPLALYNNGDGILSLSISFFANVTLLWSWVDFGSNPFNGVSWFLSTTILFSAVAPLIIRTISKIKKVKLVAILLAGILAIQFSLAFLCESLLNDRWLIYVFPPIRLLDCISGCLVFKLAESIKNHVHNIGSLLFLLLFMCLGGGCYALTFFFAHQVFQTAVWSIPSLGIITFLYLGDSVSKLIRKIFGNAVFQKLGVITFEFFLFHELCLRYLRGAYKIILGREQDAVLVIVALILSVSGAMLLHYIVSKIKNRRKKFFVTETEKIETPEETAADVPAETGDEPEE